MTRTTSRPGVVRLITRMNIGGPARHALLLSKGLASRYETTLAAGKATAAEGELNDPAVPVYRVPLVRPIQPSMDARALAAVRRLLVQRGPALMHTHMAKAGSVGRLAALSIRPRPRLVHTFHGHVLDGYFGRSARRAFTETERMLARTTDALVAVSPEIRDELLELGRGRPSQYHVIPLGLDLSTLLAVEEPFHRFRSQLGLSLSQPLIGVVGRLVPIKDHATLLEAMRLLPDAHLAVVGDGELRGELEARVRHMGLADRVHFTGWWSDMAAVFSDLDAVVLTSRNEGTPVALIEASAAGRAVVATDIGGVRSVVVDEVTGLLAPVGDSETIAARLARLLREPRAKRRMGEAGRAHVRARFGHERLLQDVTSLYCDLLSGSPRRSPAVQ